MAGARRVAAAWTHGIALVRRCRLVSGCPRMVSTRAIELGLDRIRKQPDPIPLELGEIASEPEVAEAAAGQLEQLVPQLCPRDAPAQLGQRAQRSPRRVGVNLLQLHFVAGSDAPPAEPMTRLSQATINGCPSWGVRVVEPPHVRTQAAVTAPRVTTPSPLGMAMRRSGLKTMASPSKGALSRGGLSWVGSTAGSGWGLSSWSQVSRWGPRRSPRRHRHRARPRYRRCTCTKSRVERRGIAAEPRAPQVKSERVVDAVDTPADRRPAPPLDGNRALGCPGMVEYCGAPADRRHRFVGRSVRRCDVEYGGTVPIREPMWETA